MRKLLALPLLALLALGACTDPYGRPDPLATGLLGAGLGAAAGIGIAAANQPRQHSYYAPPRRHYGYAAPRAHYGYARPAPVYAYPAPRHHAPRYRGYW